MQIKYNLYLFFRKNMLLIIEFINNIKQKITNKKENISLSNIIAFFFTSGQCIIGPCWAALRKRMHRVHQKPRKAVQPEYDEVQRKVSSRSWVHGSSSAATLGNGRRQNFASPI